VPLTVEGERPNATAIDRTVRPTTSPREISSRSANVNTSRERRLPGSRVSRCSEIQYAIAGSEIRGMSRRF
jgi:hypothetical protein